MEQICSNLEAPNQRSSLDGTFWHSLPEKRAFQTLSTQGHLSLDAGMTTDANDLVPVTAILAEHSRLTKAPADTQPRSPAAGHQSGVMRR